MSEFFKNNLVYLRELRGENQAQTSVALGLSRSTYANYEIGENEPKAKVLLKILGHFNISFENLMTIDLRNVQERQNPEVKKVKENVQENVQEHVQERTLQQQNEGAGPPVVNLFPKVVTVDSRGNENMVLIQSKARAGYLNGYGDPEYINTLAAYRLPGYNEGNFRMFEVAGLSMHPTLNDGDILITRSVESLTGIKNDHIHVVVTNDDGIVVKRVLNRIERDNKLILKSDNIKDRHEYPNMVIDPSQVLEIWYVIGYISRIMKSPTEIYDRLIDLEGRLTIMEHNAKKQGR